MWGSGENRDVRVDVNSLQQIMALEERSRKAEFQRLQAARQAEIERLQKQVESMEAARLAEIQRLQAVHQDEVKRLVNAWSNEVKRLQQAQREPVEPESGPTLVATPARERWWRRLNWKQCVVNFVVLLFVVGIGLSAATTATYSKATWRQDALTLGLAAMGVVFIIHTWWTKRSQLYTPNATLKAHRDRLPREAAVRGRVRFDHEGRRGDTGTREGGGRAERIVE